MGHHAKNDTAQRGGGEKNPANPVGSPPFDGGAGELTGILAERLNFFSKGGEPATDRPRNLSPAALNGLDIVGGDPVRHEVTKWGGFGSWWRYLEAIQGTASDVRQFVALFLCFYIFGVRLYLNTTQCRGSELI